MLWGGGTAVGRGCCEMCGDMGQEGAGKAWGAQGRENRAARTSAGRGTGRCWKGAVSIGFEFWGDGGKGLLHGERLQGFPYRADGTQGQPLFLCLGSGVQELLSFSDLWSQYIVMLEML